MHSIIEKFSNEYRWLSNMVILDNQIVDDMGIAYGSTENYYQANKSIDIEIRKYIANLKPTLSKKAGQEIEIRDDWENVKIDVMYKALQLKFNQPNYKEMLLSTGDMYIQEGNTWGDKYWGVCLKTNTGQNHLGKLIMKIRDELKKHMN